MTSETLHFDNPRVALQVLGNDPGNLDTLQQELGVRAVARDAWIKLEGEPDNVARARDLFRLLERTVVGGGGIRKHEFAVALGIVKHDGAEALEGLQKERLQPSPKMATVLPKTVGQRRYLEAIRTHPVTFGIGPAGTGKTYLGMAAAVAALKAGEVNRLILTRPAVEAGEALGFLPGDLMEKLAPYLRPLYDALHDLLPAEEIQRNMERGIIEIAPLAYMRGRTLNSSFIIFDEAQNSTEEQMFMFLTRLGFNSRAVITGDLTQIDLPRQKTSGLFEARDALARTDGVGIVLLDKRDVIRHPLVQRILTAYEEHRGPPQ